MRSTPASNPLPRRHRGRASLTLLVALCAVAGGTQALTAAPAAAMDGVSDGTGCELRGGLPQGFGINKFGEICILEIGGGGSGNGSGSGPLGVGYGGGGGSSAAPAPNPAPTAWQPGQVYRPEAKGPALCIVWPHRCWEPTGGGSAGPLRQQAEEKGKGSHETPRGNPSKGKSSKPAPGHKGDPEECAAIPSVKVPDDVVQMKDRRISRVEGFREAAKVKLRKLTPKDPKAWSDFPEEWYELEDDIAMYTREINSLMAELSAVHDARVNWSRLDCQGEPPWEQAQRERHKRPR